jgi:hypothetical protein
MSALDKLREIASKRGIIERTKIRERKRGKRAMKN